MTIRELIDELEDLASDYGDGTEVRLAHQPSWPFEYSVSTVAAVDPNDPDEDEDEESADPDDGDEDAVDDPAVVYIAEGSQLGYLPGAATRALGWGRR